jgi:multidrug resistance efflux pump
MPSARLITAAYSAAPRWLEATGSVRAQLEANIATKVQGRVMEVYVHEGDRVRRGQPLLTLDARDLEAGIAQAEANRRASVVGYDNARVTAQMEASTSAARIAQAEAQVTNAEAAVQSARARKDLVRSGPRRQEKVQAGLAVAQAQSSLTLAETNLRRMTSLFSQGAVARQQVDVAQNQYDLAKAQYDTAVQSRSIAEEGSRQEDIRSAEEAVRQAEAGLVEARAGLREARAGALQVNVRRQQIRGAQAQIGQSDAAVRLARVTRDYATINAPFDGIVTQRLADPGALASPGVPLLTVQGGPIRLEAVVPEGALASARKGAAVPVSLDALPGKALTGRISEVAPQGDAQSHTFLVKIDLPASLARSGMFGRARFRTARTAACFSPARRWWSARAFPTCSRPARTTAPACAW